MNKLASVGTALVVIVVAAGLSYWFGLRAGQEVENQNLASTQAMLALGHYRSYQRLESLLVRKCHEAALTEATQLKNLQVSLLASNLRASGNDSELVAYIKTREPQLLDEISVGRVPELRSYSTTCP